MKKFNELYICVDEDIFGPEDDLTDEEREDEFEAEQANKSAREAFELSRGCEKYGK